MPTTRQVIADFNNPQHPLSAFLAEYRGESLGWGLYRTVFAVNGCKHLVIKVARDLDGNSSNFWEWEIWGFIRDHPQSRWLAPCHAISVDYSVLLMTRTHPCEVKLPRIPSWITDTKTQNWGKLPRGGVVCHDYSTNLLFNEIMVPKMKKVRWWKGKNHE